MIAGAAGVGALGGGAASRKGMAKMYDSWLKSDAARNANILESLKKHKAEFQQAQKHFDDLKSQVDAKWNQDLHRKAREAEKVMARKRMAVMLSESELEAGEDSLKKLQKYRDRDVRRSTLTGASRGAMIGGGGMGLGVGAHDLRQSHKDRKNRKD